VLGAGVVLTRSTKVYDLVHEREIASVGDAPLEIPAGAVVVPGSRPASSEYARRLGLHVATPLVVKYRDDKTDAKAALESALRA
jgi:2,3,4,5-tetrahydropyridine-2,6-dicarboxylate N-succinyltransferase